MSPWWKSSFAFPVTERPLTEWPRPSNLFTPPPKSTHNLFLAASQWTGIKAGWHIGILVIAASLLTRGRKLDLIKVNFLAQTCVYGQKINCFPWTVLKPVTVNTFSSLHNEPICTCQFRLLAWQKALCHANNLNWPIAGKKVQSLFLRSSNKWRRNGRWWGVVDSTIHSHCY